MSITSSVLDAEPHTQTDGRRYVTENHFSNADLIIWLHRLAPSGEDSNAVMLARVPTIEAHLKRKEIRDNIHQISVLGDQASFTLDWSTAPENVDALRDAYQDAFQLEAIMMADFLESLSDAALMNAFGLSQGQVNNLRTNKLEPASDLADQIRAVIGI